MRGFYFSTKPAPAQLNQRCTYIPSNDVAADARCSFSPSRVAHCTRQPRRFAPSFPRGARLQVSRYVHTEGLLSWATFSKQTLHRVSNSGRKSPLGGHGWISSPKRRETASFRPSRLCSVSLTGECTRWGSQGDGSSSISDEGIRRAVGIQPGELRLHPQDSA